VKAEGRNPPHLLATISDRNRRRRGTHKNSSAFEQILTSEGKRIEKMLEKEGSAVVNAGRSPLTPLKKGGK
jgi:hypothetical protein